MSTPIVPCDGSNNAHKIEMYGNTNQIGPSPGCGGVMTAYISQSNPPASEFYCSKCKTSRFFTADELRMVQGRN